MCGIIGYVGEENSVNILLSGLQALEYRGYDSAGISLINNNSFKTIKTAGSPSELYEKVRGLTSSIGIGHTRWATHGAPTPENAHPHLSKSGLFSVVHNGIIENYLELKDKLITKNYNFKSETDTEVIAHLLEENYNGDLKGTVIKTLSLLKGAYALGILCNDYPDTIICAKNQSPLFAGNAEGNTYLSSDISAIADKCDRIFKLNDGEIGILKKDNIKVFDSEGCRIRKSEIKIKSKIKLNDKNGFDHYMLKEIFEQPTAVRNTLSDVIKGNRLNLKNIKWSAEEIKKINNVRFIACGSAFHAGMVGAYLTEEFFKRTAKAEIASEFRYKNAHIDENTLVIIISQSGETADTLAALRISKEKGAKIISIVNVENSSIAMESDCVILTRAGQEIAVATTKAYSSQLAVIYSLILYLSYISGETDKNTISKIINELKLIPEKIEIILSDLNSIIGIAERISDFDYICFIGRCYGHCTAMEGSLKLKEISYIPCEAYAAGELKHGTISLIDEQSLVIALSSSAAVRSKILSNIKEVEARNGKVIKITTSEDSGDIIIPQTSDCLYPMLEVIPLQLLSYYVAKKKGCSIDKPKNLAKSVTVE